MNSSYVNEDTTIKSSDRRYRRFLAKAEGYITKYQASHGPPSATTSDGVEDGAATTTRHLDFLKKAHGFMNKKEEEKSDDGEGNNKELKKKKKENDENNNDSHHKEYLKLAHAMLKNIKKHKKKQKKNKYGKNNHGYGGGEGEAEAEEEEEEEEEESDEFEEEEEVEEGEEGGWFSHLLEGISSIGEAFEES